MRADAGAEAGWPPTEAEGPSDGDPPALPARTGGPGAEGQARQGTAQASTRLPEHPPLRALVVFAGEGTALSTLTSELQARGAEVEAIDTALGGSDHDLTVPAVAERVLGWVRARHFHAVFAAP
eukprot:6190784-Pleurochrysis_carterae.AAC.1